jgi:alkylation response protein AidB-like acyl-CoA dehydrogenase
MELDFSSEQNMLRETASKFFAKECPSDKVKELEESDAGYSPELWRKMADLGWLGVLFPEECGGYGGQFIDTAIIIEEMGKAAFPSPYFSTVIQCGQIILTGGSDAQKKELLPKISDGSLIMAFAQFESDGSYLPEGINLSARRDENSYILNGTKMFVMDANIADRIIVTAKASDAGITLFLTDAKDKGISISKMPAIGMDNVCEVVFKDVKVPAEKIIGSPGTGWDLLAKTESAVTAAKCAEMIGGCKKAIDLTANYSKERSQYGVPIGGFQIIQHYMANMLLAYDTIWNYLYRIVWMIDEGIECGKEASALKSQVNVNYKFITERGVQIHGGVGTSREFDIGLFYRRAKSFEYIAGDTDYHYEKIAAALEL